MTNRQTLLSGRLTQQRRGTGLWKKATSVLIGTGWKGRTERLLDAIFTQNVNEVRRLITEENADVNRGLAPSTFNRRRSLIHQHDTYVPRHYPNKQLFRSKHPIHEAIYTNNLQILKTLLTSPNIDFGIKSNAGFVTDVEPLALASYLTKEEFVEEMLKHKNIQQSHIKHAIDFLTHHLNITLQDKEQIYTKHLRSMHPRWEKIVIILKNELDVRKEIERQEKRIGRKLNQQQRQGIKRQVIAKLKAQQKKQES